MASCAANGCGRWRPDLLVGTARVGFRLDGAWYCSQICLQSEATRRLEALSADDSPQMPAFRRLRLGAFLVHHRAITKAQLAAALTEQKRSGLRLGRILVAHGIAAPAEVVRGLAAQVGLDYLTAIDTACVREAPGNFSARAVRQLGLVPFAVQEAQRLLKVACCAPVPREAVQAVRAITEWEVEPFLVWDDHWQRLARAYGQARPQHGSEDDWMTADSVSDAAAHIAHRVARGQVQRMHYARCSPFVWVRLEGRRSEDLWLPMANRRRNQWQAEHTSH